jgi:hypothetical protein
MTSIKPGLCLVAFLLAGCAGITVRQLKPDLTDTKGPRGLPYYMPAPYLVVAELPPTATSAQMGTAPPLQGRPARHCPTQNPLQPQIRDGGRGGIRDRLSSSLQARPRPVMGVTKQEVIRAD